MVERTKILLAVVITAVITFLLTIGLLFGGFFGFVFLTDKKYKENSQKVEQAKVDGREFGKTTDQNGCMEKGFSFEATGESYYLDLGFLDECLKSSKPVTNFCDGVPDCDPSDNWEDEQCQKSWSYRGILFSCILCQI